MELLPHPIPDLVEGRGLSKGKPQCEAFWSGWYSFMVLAGLGCPWTHDSSGCFHLRGGAAVSHQLTLTLTSMRSAETAATPRIHSKGSLKNRRQWRVCQLCQALSSPNSSRNKISTGLKPSQLAGAQASPTCRPPGSWLAHGAPMALLH